MYKLKYVSQTKPEITKNIKLSNEIINISFESLVTKFNRVVISQSHKLKNHLCDFDECYQLCLITLWESWKLENTDYSIYTIFIRNSYFKIINECKKRNRHYINNVSLYTPLSKENETSTLEDLLYEDDSTLEYTEERIILKKILSKLSSQEQNIFLNKTLNNVNKVDYNLRERLLNKIRIMYSKTLSIN